MTKKIGKRWLALGVCLILSSLIWLVFGQTLQHGFVNYDDPQYVLKNPQVVSGLTRSGIVWAFTHVYASNWHPLTWLSHMLDCQLYGLQPWGHHLTNVLLHAATAILLFLVLTQMTAALGRSAFVASIFAIHPLRVESVAWISERKDVLSGLFFVLTIGAYVRYIRRPTGARYAILLFLFALGLLSKPMLVTLPIVLLLLDYWPLGRWPDQSARTRRLRQILWEKIPMVALALASVVMTLIAQRLVIRPVAILSLPVRIENAFISCVAYIRQMFWPSDLALLYPLSPSEVRVLPALFSLALLLAISIGVFLARRHRYLVTGWLWYLVMLLPVIGLVQVGIQARADRYTYLPQIGLCLLLTWVAADLFAHARWARAVRNALVVGIIGTLALCARVQASYWHDRETLWRMTVARTSENAPAYVNLGQALYENGKAAEAIAAFETAVRFNPKLPMAHSSLGVALLETGQPEQSIIHLQEALRLAPQFAEAHYNLGNTYLATGQGKKAIEHYSQAIALDPEDVEAQNNLAWLLATSPRSEIRDGTKALELAQRADSLIHAKSAVIAGTLAAAYAEAGRFDDAVNAGQRALQLADAEGNLARANSIRAQIALYQSGRPFRDQR